ncbi:hypothetical protein KLEB273_gp293 [Bacillus phage vB_BauM_KLEB27-3]|nr:hypothetical protein KLEB273_gp293 [Bacillus phage vB_BauM_KLEB27-3]
MSSITIGLSLCILALVTTIAVNHHMLAITSCLATLLFIIVSR